VTTTLRFGYRIGRNAVLRVGCSGALFDPDCRILLTQRRDNGLWCLPAGGMEPGESAAETCVREFSEETGLDVRVERLIGLHSSPHCVVEYSNGLGRRRIVSMLFQVE
jgi:8-oxo-dGTP pyrophosphatase MutT (NUDIX family)